MAAWWPALRPFSLTRSRQSVSGGRHASKAPRHPGCPKRSASITGVITSSSRNDPDICQGARVPAPSSRASNSCTLEVAPRALASKMSYLCTTASHSSTSSSSRRANAMGLSCRMMPRIHKFTAGGVSFHIWHIHTPASRSRCNDVRAQLRGPQGRRRAASAALLSGIPHTEKKKNWNTG